MPAHAAVFAGDPNGDEKAQETFENSRRNFLALVFCLMVGTAALPHILMRYYTTPSVKEARESVTWSLFFIFLLYFTAPALAVLVKFEVFNNLVGTARSTSCRSGFPTGHVSTLACCRWPTSTSDGIFQLGEMKIGGDIIVLATPKSVACRMWCRAWWRPAAWPRRCPPPTVCC
jgi:cation/acetate symporter